MIWVKLDNQISAIQNSVVRVYIIYLPELWKFNYLLIWLNERWPKSIKIGFDKITKKWIYWIL